MKKCAVCNVEMLKKDWERPSQFKKRVVCSLKCRQKYIVKKKQEKYIAPTCKQCGKKINTVDRAGKRSSRRKFCNNECFRKWNRGENCSHWKGGRKKHGKYIQVLVGKEHPYSDFHGYIMEHRKVVEEYFRNKIINGTMEEKDYKYIVEINKNIYLSPVVKVHHINHIKTDNRIENLHPVLSQKEHFHFNYCPHCPHCNKSGELLGNPKG